MEQVAVGRVDLDDLETRRQGPPGRCLERRPRFRRSRPRQGGPARDLLPRRGSGWGQRRSMPPPAASIRRFPLSRVSRNWPCVRRVQAGFPERLPGTGQSERSAEGIHVDIGPDSHVAGRDSTLGRHGRRLDHDQPHAAGRPASQVNQVPVVGQPPSAEYWHIGDMATRLRGDAPDRHRAEQAGFDGGLVPSLPPVLALSLSSFIATLEEVVRPCPCPAAILQLLGWYRRSQRSSTRTDWTATWRMRPSERVVSGGSKETFRTTKGVTATRWVTWEGERNVLPTRRFARMGPAMPRSFR